MITMTGTITVFIRGRWIVKPFSTDSRVWLWGGWPPQHRLEKLISKDDELATKIAGEVAEECKLRLKVCDLAGPRGWISAHINRVKATPTIIIDTHRIEGLPRKDELLRIVRSTKEDVC